MGEQNVEMTGDWFPWNYENIDEEDRVREKGRKEKGSNQEKLKPMNGGEGVINDLKYEEIWGRKVWMRQEIMKTLMK